MSRMRMHWRVLHAAAVAVLAVALASPVLGADPTSVPAVPSQDEAARALLLRMADFMAQAPALSVTMRSGYDAIQQDGQRIEFGERRRFRLQRPDKLRVDLERSDGERGTVVFDGRWITAYKPAENVYARVEKAGTSDQALVYMVRDLRATLPLARMFTTGFPADLRKRVTAVSFVEACTLFDVPTDHIAVRTAEVDMQLWIATGKEPLPRRIVVTYKSSPGEPQFRADLSDWSVKAGKDRSTFAFVPPPGAEQIKYLAPLPPADNSAASAGEQP